MGSGFCHIARDNPRVYSINNLLKMEGTIKTLTERGFGFIEREGEDDLFFHSNDLVDERFDDLKVGDKVSFEVASSNKGPKAANVSRV